MNDDTSAKKKKAKELTKRILEEEATIKEEEIKKPHRKKKVDKESKEEEPKKKTSKIYRDSYRIYRVSDNKYSTDYIVQMIYSEGEYFVFDLLRPGERKIPEDVKNKNYRRARLKIKFQCCYNDVIANVPVELVIEIIDYYESLGDMREITIDEWVQKRGMEALVEIAKDECDDWQDGYKPCKEPRDIEVLEKEEIIMVPPKPPVPTDVFDRIERLEGLIEDSYKTIMEYEDMIANILKIREVDKTEEDKVKLLRLDGYIRAEKENIRKFEFEINRLKKEWKIE